MELPDIRNASNDALFNLAAQESTEARFALTRRLQKLRWIGKDSEADALIEQLKTRAPHAIIVATSVYGTD